MAERKAIIKKDSKLSKVKKCNLLEMNRSTLYYEPTERLSDSEELEIVKQMIERELKNRL